MDGAAAVEYAVRNGIPGAFVECGVEAGDKEVDWIGQLQRMDACDRDIYMYDTFAGLTEPSSHDFTRQDGCYAMTAAQVHDEWRSKQAGGVNGWCYCPLERVQQRLAATGYPSDKLHYVVGDVADTLRRDVPEQIAILRMDTDWYESSKVEMEVLFPRVVEGGVVIMDDYFHWDGQRRATDEYLDAHCPGYNIVRLSQKVGAFIK